MTLQILHTTNNVHQSFQVSRISIFALCACNKSVNLAWSKESFQRNPKHRECPIFPPNKNHFPRAGHGENFFYIPHFAPHQVLSCVTHFEASVAAAAYIANLTYCRAGGRVEEQGEEEIRFHFFSSPFHLLGIYRLLLLALSVYSALNDAGWPPGEPNKAPVSEVERSNGFNSENSSSVVFGITCFVCISV